jgi:hypothetical protein
LSASRRSDRRWRPQLRNQPQDIGEQNSGDGDWLTTFAPILMSLSFRIVSDQSLIGSGIASVRRKITKIVGERMKLETNRVGGDGE